MKKEKARPIKNFVLENKFLKITFLNLGATILEIIDKKTNRNLVARHQDIEQYRENPGNLGCVVGVNANRIENARFSINQETFQLEANENDHNLHSGKKNLQHRFFDVVESENNLTFKTTLSHLEDDFPGERHIEINYSLEGNKLIIDYSATTDRPTIFNLTNHSYFNLDGADSDSIDQHTLKLSAPFFLPNHPDGIPTNEILSVQNTTMNFIQGKKLQEVIYRPVEQIQNFNGLDHCFLIHSETNEAPSHVATLASSTQDIYLDVYSDLPAVQIYTSNHFTEEDQLHNELNKALLQHQHICIETQFPPNAINVAWLKAPLFDDCKPYSSQTIFKFSHNKKEA